jgi:hypothetical protein
MNYCVSRLDRVEFDAESGSIKIIFQPAGVKQLNEELIEEVAK